MQVRPRVVIVFVGRGRETDRIEELFARVRAGRSGVLLIEGDAGAGKTTLLDLAECRAAQMTVLRTVGVAGAQDVAFSGLFSVLRPFLDMVEELPGPQAEALRVVLGEFAPGGVLAGQRAVPAALEAAGFTWSHPDLESALRSALGRD